MRKIVNFNDGWQFIKNTDKVYTDIEEAGEIVNLPHTWNAKDGQDGGNDYFRGRCVYIKRINKNELPEEEMYFLEIGAANSSADIYVDGEHIMHHDGGYSRFRADITDGVRSSAVICIAVDNSPNTEVYPQTADFTFYGGIYRSVNIIAVPKAHISLEYYGSEGITVTPTVKDNEAEVEIVAYTAGASRDMTVAFSIFDKEGNEVDTKTVPADNARASLKVKSPHLWHGRRNPYLYKAVAELRDKEKIIDKVESSFGIRSFLIDSELGFILNGEEYALRGVSRHQDRLGIGNALLPCHHKEDMELIYELGATTIRLAHYQHDEYFYDLCDEYGMVVWAEIPYISNHMKGGRENTVSQLKELIIQNYNHPSIVVWGLSNEITMKGEDDPDLIENHKILNDLAHQLDKTRKTAIAALSMCKTDAEYLKIPDAVSYNHYFGWYGGEVSMNGEWLDNFHRSYPNIPLGVSEYGAEGLNWHTSNPTQGDYTEEYQAYYHEEMIKQLFKRKYLWATHVWNMFDFGADARCEGGENGQNHKGLVTFDRKYKKDAFYAYKAWLSDEPFVHITSKRYVDRTEDITTVKVYSNLPEVELFANGKSLGKMENCEHFFAFKVKNEGTTRLLAKAGEHTDESVIRKVDKPNEDYILKESGAVLNWFDITVPEGYLSLNDKISEILKSEEGAKWFNALSEKMKSKAKEASSEGAFTIPEGMEKMLGGFTALRFLNLSGMMNVSFTKEELLEMNKELNKIKKI